MKLWNIETQQEMLTLTRFSGEAGEVLFSSDGSYLAANSPDGYVHLWRAPSLEEIAVTEVREKAEGKER